MFLLAGLMGVLAVGATVLVGLEVASEPEADPEEDARDEAAQVAASQSAETDDLIEVAMGLVEAVPTEEVAATGGETPDISDSYGWLWPNDQGSANGMSYSHHIASVDLDGEMRERPEPDEDAVESDDAVHWLDQMHQDQVTDFSPEDDRLVIVYDDRVDPDPDVALEEDADDFSLTHITLNGVRIATVDEAEGLTLDHVMLVAESTLSDAEAA